MDSNQVNQNHLKPPLYEFKQLVIQDIPDIKELVTNSFFKYGVLFHILEMTREDCVDLFKTIDFVILIQQELSFGAFYQGKLVSLAIVCDFTIKYKNEYPMTPKVNQFVTILSSLMDEYNQTHSINKGELAYLYRVATDEKHFQNKLAQILIGMACQKAKTMGFCNFITDATHIGTIKSVQNIFKVWNIEKEFQSVNTRPTQMMIMSAKL